MDTEKSFAAYALVLIAAVASVLTASLVAGVARLPSPLVFLEHVALGLAMRASYKSIGGWNWADWTFTVDRPSEAGAARDFATPGGAAGAEA